MTTRRCITMVRDPYQLGLQNRETVGFRLANMLRARTACTFSIAQLLKVRAPTLRCFVHFDLQMCFGPRRRANYSSFIWRAGSAPAALARLLFDSGATNHWKNRVFWDFPYLFAHLHLFSSDLLHLLSSPFWLSPLPSFFLALICPYCRNFSF